jgi:DNA-binding LytR/AlgR family response regulator
MAAIGTLRAVIADDEAGARAHLRLLLEDCRVRTVDECATGVDTIQAVRRTRPHVVCLDVRMPDLDGLQVARQLGGAAALVFTTGFSHYAAEAFELDAADYLLKPLSASRVADAVRRVRARVRRTAIGTVAGSGPAAPVSAPPRLFIPKEDYSIAVAPDQIRMIEAGEGHVLVHTDDGSYRLRASLTRLERVLSPWGFLRTHRGLPGQPGPRRSARAVVALRAQPAARRRAGDSRPGRKVTTRRVSSQRDLDLACRRTAQWTWV